MSNALDGQAPLAAKVPLVAGFGARGYDGHEVIALADLLANLLIPGVAPAQLALVQPDLDAELRQRIADRSRGLTVFGCIAQEYRCRQRAIPRVVLEGGP